MDQYTAKEALARLVTGNQRFMSGKARFPAIRKDILRNLAKEGQRPYATILGCSDSRVPVELLFDAGFGELFVIRVAGNVISPEIMGSMQYAGTILRTPLFVILGHEGCGAVQAALAAKQKKGTRQGRHIEALLANIVPGLRGASTLPTAVEANVRWSMHQVMATPEGKAGAERGVKLVGAIYELETGRVRFLPDIISPSRP
jgi:carbonic anhydrase